MRFLASMTHVTWDHDAMADSAARVPRAANVTLQGVTAEFWPSGHICAFLQLPEVHASLHFILNWFLQPVFTRAYTYFLFHVRSTCFYRLRNLLETSFLLSMFMHMHHESALSAIRSPLCCSWHLSTATASHLLGLSTANWGATNKASV